VQATYERQPAPVATITTTNVSFDAAGNVTETVQTAENPADPTQTSTLHTVAKLADRNEDPRVRGLAAEALTEAGERRAVPSLIAVLGDPSVEVRFWAAFALGELGNPAALGTTTARIGQRPAHLRISDSVMITNNPTAARST